MKVFRHRSGSGRSSLSNALLDGHKVAGLTEVRQGPPVEAQYQPPHVSPLRRRQLGEACAGFDAVAADLRHARPRRRRRTSARSSSRSTTSTGRRTRSIAAAAEAAAFAAWCRSSVSFSTPMVARGLDHRGRPLSVAALEPPRRGRTRPRSHQLPEAVVLRFGSVVGDDPAGRGWTARAGRPSAQAGAQAHLVHPEVPAAAR